jgi:hypothetical protein
MHYYLGNILAGFSRGERIRVSELIQRKDDNVLCYSGGSGGWGKRK